jgi:hypothetical protein
MLLLGKLVDILCTMCSEARNKAIMWLEISYTRCARQMADISGVKVTSVGLRKVSWSRFLGSGLCWPRLTGRIPDTIKRREVVRNAGRKRQE